MTSVISSPDVLRRTLKEQKSENLEVLRKWIELNLNYVVWIALPFIGKESKIFNKFSKKLLSISEGWGTGIVDPLDQETTDYIKERVNYLVKLGFDGLKVDFIDSIIDPDDRDDVYRKIVR